MIANQNIVGFLWLLNLFIISVLTAGTQDQQGCVQFTVANHCCSLPFVYKGTTYHSCTKENSGFLGFYQIYWCAYADEKYDQCKGPIYVPSAESTRNSNKTVLSTVLKASSIATNFPNRETSSFSLTTSVATQSLNVHRTRVDEASVRSSNPSLVEFFSTSSKTESGNSSLSSHEKRKKSKNVAVLAGGIVGGGVLIIIIIIIAVCFVVRKKEARSLKDKNEKLVIDKEETINPLYEEAEDGNAETVVTRAHLYEEVDLNVHGKSDLPLVQMNPIYTST